MRCLVKILEEGRDKFNKGCSLDLALEETEFIRNTDTQCGFIIDSEKSIRQSQNLKHSRFTIPEDRRIPSIMKSIQLAMKNLPYTAV